MRIARAIVALALLSAAPSTAGATATPGWFEYLHVEANEGGSSGGHAAIRLGDEVFHFQHHAGGLLRLHRVGAEAFLHDYARLANRAVHVQRVAVSAETEARLRRSFGARLVDEDGRFATLAALEAERDLLAALDHGAPPLLALRGAAFFATPSARPEPALAAVAARAVDTHGADLVARRTAEVTDALANLRPEDRVSAATPIGERSPAPLVHRAAELLEAELALRVLRTAPPLQPGALRDAALDELVLTADERGALAAHAAALERRAVALVASPRPDFGSALLLALARRAAVARSLDAGRLVVLDAYPPDATRLTAGEVAAHAAHLPDLLAESHAELVAARRALAAAAGAPEQAFTALEAALNRYLELRGAIVAGSDLRLARGALLPSGSATVPAPLPPGAPTGALHAAAADAAARAAAYRGELRSHNGYDLLARNCVSEIFHAIAIALADQDQDDDAADDALSCAAATRELGGCIDPAARLRIIPFVAAAAVAAEYRVETAYDIPSYRTARLAEMYAHENDLLVFLREANVLTSSVYRGRDEDSAFLFFTDDAPLARPLLGAANLAVGVGASAAGLLAWPADGGDLLVRGLRGTMFSLPELAFVAIRKGSFAYAPRAPLADASAASAPSSGAGTPG